MKIYLPEGSLPTSQQLDDAIAEATTLSNNVKRFTHNLSIDERVSSYKMGTRRFAYAKAAARIGKQHEEAMPRQFVPNNFANNINLIDQLQALKSIIGQLYEQIDDTLMAARIDAMTYTKQVHDSLRIANIINPAYDTPLKELDEFNARAVAEDATTTDTNTMTVNGNDINN